MIISKPRNSRWLKPWYKRAVCARKRRKWPASDQIFEWSQFFCSPHEEGDSRLCVLLRRVVSMQQRIRSLEGEVSRMINARTNQQEYLDRALAAIQRCFPSVQEVNNCLLFLLRLLLIFVSTSMYHGVLVGHGWVGRARLTHREVITFAARFAKPLHSWLVRWK